MATFCDELKLMREMAQSKYEKHKQNGKSKVVVCTIANNKNDKNTTTNSMNNDILLRYSRKETIFDQIKCSHSIHMKCIHCVSLQLLPFNKYEISLKNGLYNFIFSNKNNKQSLQDLIKICCSANPNLLQKVQPRSSLQYGEILFYSFAHILHKITSLCPSFNYQNAIFIDLGSGIAKTLFIAALLYPFQQCIGIEIIHKLHQKALYFKQNASNEYHHLFECTTNNILLIHGNIFNKTLLEQQCFSNDSHYIIFIASTAFNNNMMRDLGNTLDDIFQSQYHKSKHIWIITLSHALPNRKTFKLKHQGMFRMSWGNVTVYFQKYINQSHI